jgi:hypothetical protein
MTQTKHFGFKTGSICTDSNIYRCSDGTFEVIEYVAAGTAFPSEPFNNGKNKTNWQKITLETEGSRETLDGGNTSTSDTSTAAV